jgi:hypothetical protein
MCSAIMWDTENPQATCRLEHVSLKVSMSYAPPFLGKYSLAVWSIPFLFHWLVNGFKISSTEIDIYD